MIRTSPRFPQQIALAALLLAVTIPCAQADQFLAEALAQAINSAPELDADARRVLSQSAADAALPLPSFTNDVTLRLGRDLSAAIRGRAWPFESWQRHTTPEGVAWLRAALALAIDRLPQLPLPSAAELVEIQAYAGQAGGALQAFNYEALKDERAEFRDGVITALRDDLRARAPLFGNAFVPMLLRPCAQGDAPDHRDTGVRGHVMSRLRQAGHLAILRNSNEHFDLDALIAAECSRQMSVVMAALHELTILCIRQLEAIVLPPQWLTDQSVALQEREEELFRAALRDAAAPPGETEAEQLQRKAASAASGNERLSHDDAVRLAFLGTGIEVTNSTPILPRSWAKSIELARGSRATERRVRSSGE